MSSSGAHWIGLTAAIAMLLGAGGVKFLSHHKGSPHAGPLPGVSRRSVPPIAEDLRVQFPQAESRGGITPEQKGSGSSAGWAVKYGQEFWRRRSVTPPPVQGNPLSAPLAQDRLQDAIDRVSHGFRQSANEETVRTGDRGYEAVLGNGGLAFVAQSNGGEAAVVAQLNTRALRQGGCLTHVSSARFSDWAVSGNTVQRLVDADSGLVEHFEANRGGVEVTWVLPHAPAKPGEVELEVELSGVQFCRETPGGLHFADANGIARVKVGPALAVDGRGQSWPLPMQGTESGLSVTVPAAVMAEASFPLAIDPVISAEFGLDQPVDAPTPCTRAAPAVAAGDSLYLVVWTHGKSDATAPGVYGARVDAVGNVLDRYGLFISGLAGEQTVCAVAANAGTFLVTWSAPHTNSTTDWDILGARVLPDGTVQDPSPLPICTLSSSLQNSPAVAGNGDNFLVVWRDSRGTGIYGTVVKTNGQIAPTNGLAICAAANEQFTPAVAALGTNYLVAWQDYRKATSTQFTADIYGARVTGDGVVQDVSGIAICTRTNTQFHPAIAANGTNYLVVWEDYDREGDDILGARVSPEGVLLDTNPIVVVHGANAQANPAAVGLGGDYLVLWQDYRDTSTNTYAARTYGARVRGDGSVLDTNGVALSTGSGGQWYPSVAGHGDHYLAVWQDARDNPGTTWSDIFGTPLTFATNLEAGGESRISGSVNLQLTPAVVTNGTNFLAVWTDLRNLATSGADIYGVRLAQDGTVLDATAIPICTATNLQADPAVAANGVDYLVVWSDYRNTPTNATHGDIYGSFVSANGVVQHPAGLPICTATNDQSLPAIALLGTNFLVIWQDARSSPPTVARLDVYGARLNAQGVVLDPAGVPICTNIANQTTPALAANSQQALAVWADARTGGLYTDIYGARLDAQGTVLDTNGLVICTATLIQSAPTVATDGQDFFVAWADGRNGAAYAPDIYGTRVTAGGVLQPFNGFPICVATGQQTAPAVSFNGLDYLVTWQGARDGISNSFAIFGTGVTAQGTPFGTLRLPIATNTYNQLNPAVAVGADGRFLVLNQSFVYGANRATGRVVNLEALPRLEPVGLLSDGQFTFRLRGAPGYSYALESSDDLVTWNPLATVLCTNFSTPWTDASSTNHLQRFYRAILLP